MPVTSDENGALSIARWRKPDRPPMKRRGRWGMRYSDL